MKKFTNEKPTKLIENWRKEFNDFYFEKGEYQNREHGITAWESFIVFLLAAAEAKGREEERNR